MNSTTRSAYTAGLRALADALDANPGIPLPVDGRLAAITVYASTEAEADATAGALGGEWEQGLSRGSHGPLLHLSGCLHGLRVKITRYLNAPVPADEALDEAPAAQPRPMAEVAAA